VKNKVLIADDDEDIRWLYGMMLADRYEVIEAENGREAVVLYKEHRPALTLMDIMMPVLPGDEAINRIFDFDPRAKIIAVTASGRTGKDLGVMVVKKGFTQKKLLEIVEKGLGKGEDPVRPPSLSGPTDRVCSGEGATTRW
jgi:two-component system chemotaxis response regulator CheY